jgi:hypothetical protein
MGSRNISQTKKFIHGELPNNSKRQRSERQCVLLFLHLPFFAFFSLGFVIMTKATADLRKKFEKKRSTQFFLFRFFDLFLSGKYLLNNDPAFFPLKKRQRAILLVDFDD